MDEEIGHLQEGVGEEDEKLAEPKGDEPDAFDARDGEKLMGIPPEEEAEKEGWEEEQPPEQDKGPYTETVDGKACPDMIDQERRAMSEKQCYEHCLADPSCTHFTWFEGTACRR